MRLLPEDPRETHRPRGADRECGAALGQRSVRSGGPPGGEKVPDQDALASLVFELLLDGTDCVAREAIPEGRFRRKEVAVDQFLECIWYLHVGAVLQGVPEVCAVDLAVPEEGAATGVEDTGGRGEEEGLDLCSYQNSPMPTALCGRPPAS